MAFELPARVSTLIEGFLGADGATSKDVRRQVFERAKGLSGAAGRHSDIPAELVPWVDKVAKAAHEITDADALALKAAGLSEDEIIELTEASALGASLARLSAALEAINSAP